MTTQDKPPPNDPKFASEVTPPRTANPHRNAIRPQPNQTVPTIPDDAPEWLLHARGEIGVHEVAGAQFAPRILEYFKCTTLGTAHASDETAWCSAFACFCMERGGIASPHRANARSWLLWGTELKQPKLGCVVVLWRGTPQSSQGHVAFYVGETAGALWLVGGNQNNAVSFSLYPKARVLSYRWPTGVAS